jgi:hypothetical protein
MKKLFSALLVSLFFLFLIGPFASAQFLNTQSNAVKTLSNSTNTAGGQAGLSQISIGAIASQIIKVVLGLLAVIFLVLLIVSGFQWMTAAGNEEQVKKSLATMKSAIIGLIIILAAYAITYFIFTYLPFSAGSTGSQGMSL